MGSISLSSCPCAETLPAGAGGQSRTACRPDLWDQGPMDRLRRPAHDRPVTRRAAALLIVGLLAACAPKGTSLITSWREPSATPRQFQKVLVLFFAPHESQREFGESELVRLMTRTRGVAAYT